MSHKGRDWYDKTRRPYSDATSTPKPPFKDINETEKERIEFTDDGRVVRDRLEDPSTGDFSKKNHRHHVEERPVAPGHSWETIFDRSDGHSNKGEVVIDRAADQARAIGQELKSMIAGRSFGRDAHNRVKSLQQEYRALHRGARSKVNLDSDFDQYYSLRRNQIDERRQQQATAASNKRDLISQAGQLRADTKGSVTQAKALQAAWKKAGSAGREEDSLWSDFRSRIDVFFKSVDDLRKRREEQERHAAGAKQLLVYEAQRLDCERDKAVHAQALNRKWREIGHAGTRESDLYRDFRLALDRFFRESKERAQQRQRDYEARQREREAKHREWEANQRAYIERQEQNVRAKQESLDRARQAFNRADAQVHEINARPGPRPGPRYYEIMGNRQRALAAASQRRDQKATWVDDARNRLAEAERRLAEARAKLRK